MNRTKWVLMPLLVCGLTAWAAAQGQATPDQPAAAQPQPAQPAPQPQAEEMGPTAGQNVGTQVQINVQPPAGQQAPQAGQAAPAPEARGTEDLSRDRDISVERRREISVERRGATDDTALRQWGELQPAGQERRMTQAGAATQPAEMGAGQAARSQRGLAGDPDIFILESPARQALRGYWGPPTARFEREEGIYGFRDEPSRLERRQHLLEQRGGMAFRDVDGIYGFEGEAGAAPAPGTAGAVNSAVLLPTPEDASHDWSEGQNLVDDNYTQNRDGFDIDRDFYTKEWKVSQPPLVEHPRFHTIYDNEMTQRYYTAWHGSPVVWSANAMTATAMPQTRNQLLSSRQKWTYFDNWDDKAISNTPATFGARATSPTGLARSQASDQMIYGYRGEDIGSAGFAGRDGSIQLGGDAFYWDDQDLLEAGTVGPGGYETFGFVEPEMERGPALGAVGADSEYYLNVPRGTDVNVFGVPGGTEIETRTTETEVYGYVDTEEKDKVEHKEAKHKDRECDKDDYDKDHDDDVDDDEDDD